MVGRIMRNNKTYENTRIILDVACPVEILKNSTYQHVVHRNAHLPYRLNKILNKRAFAKILSADKEGASC
jgi:hypothetical protein